MESLKPDSESTRSIDQLKVKEQWNSQIKILGKLGITETFPDSKSYGIRGIDGQEYPVPTPDEIINRLEANKDIILEKMNQGFTKLILVPFGYSFDNLSKKYSQTILKHYNEGKLLATKEKATDPDEALELDQDEPLWRWEDGYSKCDTEDKIVYFPKEFSKQNHGGQTKKELLKSDPANAWQILLIEDMPNIPRVGKGKVIGNRKQLETNKSSNEYLEMFQTEAEYKNESGLTPEADLMYSITHLEETNQVINDYSGKGSASRQTGAYFLSSADVPSSCWHRNCRQGGLYRNYPTNRSSNFGVRPGVRVK